MLPTVINDNSCGGCSVFISIAFTMNLSVIRLLCCPFLLRKLLD